MKLFLVHCGYYDRSVAEGIFEFHVNYFVLATDVADARRRAKQHPEFQQKRMHIDGLQEIEAVDGHALKFERVKSLNGATKIVSHSFRELAKPSTT